MNPVMLSAKGTIREASNTKEAAEVSERNWKGFGLSGCYQWCPESCVDLI